MAKTTAADAAVGAAAPTTPTPGTPATAASTAPANKATKPAHHQPTAPRPRDDFTGLGGTYTRDPATGLRTRVPPPAPAGEDTTAAA